MNGGAPEVKAANATCHLVDQLGRAENYACKHVFAKKSAPLRDAHTTARNTRTHARAMECTSAFARTTGPWIQMPGCDVLAYLKR